MVQGIYGVILSKKVKSVIKKYKCEMMFASPGEYFVRDLHCTRFENETVAGEMRMYGIFVTFGQCVIGCKIERIQNENDGIRMMKFQPSGFSSFTPASVV